MLSLILFMMIASSPLVDVHVISDLTEKEHQVLQRDHAPVFYITDDTAILLTENGDVKSVRTHLIANGVPKESLYIIPRNSLFSGVSDSDSIKVLFRAHSFLLVQVVENAKDYRDIEKFAIHLPARSLYEKSNRAVVYPALTRDPRIHETVDNLDQSTVMAYVSDLSSYNTRYTYSNTYSNVLDDVTGLLQSMGLEIKNQTFNMSFFLYPPIFHAIKNGTELTNGFSLLKWLPELETWDLYLPRFYESRSEYNADGSHIQYCSTGRIGWNTIPNEYHDLTFRWLNDPYGSFDYVARDMYKEGNDIWVCGYVNYYSLYPNVACVIHSSDDGLTWQQVLYGGNEYYTIGRFPIGDGTQQRFFAAGGQNMLHYSDDGINWNLVPVPPGNHGNITDMSGFLNPNPIPTSPTPHNDVMFIDDYGTIMITSDGGTTWQTNEDHTGFYMEKCTNVQDRLWVVCSMGSGYGVLTSDDFGETWTTKPAIPNEYYLNLWVNPENRDECWLCGSVSVHTTDGGNTWEVLPDPVFGDDTPVANIVAEKKGTENLEEVIIVCAHLDSISEDPLYDSPGVDDDASGAAAVLTCAKILSPLKLKRTVRFVLFSGSEQYDNYGSTKYAQYLSENGENVYAVLDLDCIGYTNDSLYDVFISNWDEGEPLCSFMIACQAEYVPNLIPDSYSSLYPMCIGDSTNFLEYFFPTCLVTELNPDVYNPYIEYKMDTLEHVNSELILRITKLVLATVLELAYGEGEEPVINTKPPYAYPNPLRMYQGNDAIHFVNLAVGDHVCIYELTGTKVWEQRSTGNQISWTPDASSGVYFYTLESGGEKYKGKLAVIK